MEFFNVLKNKLKMKKIILSIFSILLIFSVNAQVKVEKSKDKIVVLGRKYYVHTVKKGETLYGISKVYGIPQNQLIMINNEQVVKLEINEVLKIPIIDENYKEVEYNQVDFVKYKVKRKESLYAISKMYGITEEDIIKYNPEAKNGVKKKQILKIPVFTKKELKAEDEFFIYHQVKKGETVKSIIKKYNISKEQLLQMNPNANENFAVGEILNIPKKKLTDLEFLIITGSDAELPNFVNVDPLYFTDPSCKPCKEFTYSPDKVFKVAFLIPFFLDQNYSRSYNVVDQPNKESFYKNTEIFIHFYEGALLAVNEMRRLGLSVDLYVYDTKNDSTTVANILSKYEMRQMDLIIGPIYSDNMDIVSEFANTNKINVVSPVSKRADLLEDNPFIFQVNPSNNMLIKSSTPMLAGYYDSSLVVIHNGKDEELELMETYQKSLRKIFFNETNLDTIAFKDVMYNKDGMTAVRKALIKGQENIVFIPSSNEVFISNVLNNLNTMVSIEEYRITVYGLPSWDAFQDLELDFYRNLKIHYPSPNFVDKDDWQVQDFIKNYHDNFNTAPTVFSYQGYDVTLYFLSALKRYGKYFQFCLSSRDVDPNTKGLSLKFDFERINDKSGFENKGVHILKFDENLDLIKIE